MAAFRFLSYTKVKEHCLDLSANGVVDIRYSKFYDGKLYLPILCTSSDGGIDKAKGGVCLHEETTNDEAFVFRAIALKEGNPLETYYVTREFMADKSNYIEI